MPTDIELPTLDVEDPASRGMLLLGGAAIAGGGLIGYHAVSALMEGDLFKVDETPRADESMGRGIVTFAIGAFALVMFGTQVHDAAKEYGTGTVIIGASAITVASVVIWAIRNR